MARKFAIAREVLTKHLFMLHPVFREAMLRVKHACDELSKLRLHAMLPGALCTLPDLVDRQRTQRDMALRVLSDFSRSIVHTAQVRRAAS